MFSGKSRSRPQERKNEKEENISDRATKELAENVAKNCTEDDGGAEQKENSCDSFLPKNEGNNNESNGVCGDNTDNLESNDLNTEEESKEDDDGSEETFTESEPSAVPVCAS